ncbi:MAG: type II secretion system F family protein [Candidatus Nomurabacteria bacterium]|nr:MAG: type II secretion system F family protein [Candidatus Nomurabacteria bacterium]
MSIFTYTGVKAGKKVKGSVVADTQEQAKAQIETKGLQINGLKEEAPKSGVMDRLLNRVSIVQKLFFTQNLEVMIRTGFSLSLALQTLAQQISNKRFQWIIAQMTSDVRSGKTFASALEKHKDVFSEVFVSMIATGESSGKLQEVLKRLAVQLKKDHLLVAKVKNALTYPVIVVVAMVAIGIAVTVFVVPKLVTVFEESNVELPLPTKILITTSDVLIHYGYLIAIGVALAVVGFLRLLKLNKVRYTMDRLILKLPIAGQIVKKIHLAQLTRTLSSLLETDIHIVESFQIIARTMSNSQYRLAIEQAAEKLKTGSTIATVLGEHPDLFTPILIQMVTVGEQSGSLDQIANEVADFYESDVDDTMSNLSTIIEPILMLLLGGAVALLAVSIILPIYQLTEAI